MRMPSFTAEVALYRAAGRYRQAVDRSGRVDGQAVLPQQFGEPWPEEPRCWNVCFPVGPDGRQVCRWVCAPRRTPIPLPRRWDPTIGR
jgi:hypothetical protein